AKLVGRGGAGFDLVEDALAFLAVTLCRGLDLLEHGGSGYGELLAASCHLLHHLAHDLDFPGGRLEFAHDGFGGELADLGHALPMADVIGNGRSPRRLDRLDAERPVLDHLPDIAFDLTDIEGPRRCWMYSHDIPSPVFLASKDWMPCCQPQIAPFLRLCSRTQSEPTIFRPSRMQQLLPGYFRK